MASRADRFRVLFDEAYPPLVAYARRRVSPDDVDDVVAETLLVAWRRLDDVPQDRGVPWLFGVARNVVANRRRGDERRLRLVQRLSREPVGVGAANDGSPLVLRALAQLSPTDREVLRLAAWEGLATADIAVALGCSPNAAALRLSRARRRLREALTAPETSRTGTGVEGRRG